MDIQIKWDATSGEIEKVAGAEELDMELSMGLTVECFELNSNEVYLVEMVDGNVMAKPA